MALIALATYCTEDNGKLAMLDRTLGALENTVDTSRHHIRVKDNSPAEYRGAVSQLCANYGIPFPAWEDPDNIGTARAINTIWRYRKPGEHCIKMDDDVVIHQKGWADELEYAIQCDPSIGIIGLKRKDCWERPDEVETHKKSDLIMVNPKGSKWCIVERVQHVMGTCQMYNSALLDKIGYLYQPGLYGYDDVLAAHRSHIAGFKNCFLPHIEIDHIDPGDTPYQKWKELYTSETGIGPEVRQIIKDYYSGAKPIYHEFY